MDRWQCEIAERSRMGKYAIGMQMNGFKRRKKWMATTTIFGYITKSGSEARLPGLNLLLQRIDAYLRASNDPHTNQ